MYVVGRTGNRFGAEQRFIKDRKKYGIFVDLDFIDFFQPTQTQLIAELHKKKKKIEI